MLRICWTHHHVTVDCWSHAVLVLVLTLLACISCRLPTLHLVDNDEFVKKIWKEKSYLWLLSLFFTYLNINVWRLSCRLEVRDANQKAPNTCEGWSHFRTSSCLIPDFDWLVGWIWVKCLPSGIASLLLGYSTVVRIDISGEPSSTTHTRLDWVLEVTNGKISSVLQSLYLLTFTSYQGKNVI